MKSFFAYICILVAIVGGSSHFLASKKWVFAENINSAGFKIENSTIDVSPQEEASSGYSISQGWGLLAGREFLRQGYVVRTSFDESALSKALIFSISNTNVLFENLKANQPVTREITLQVMADGSPYQVSAIEEGPLTSKNGDIVENTKCDTARAICLEERAAPWVSNSNYGFGYSIDKPLYRPFPDSHFGESPTNIISRSEEGVKDGSTQIFLKTNITSQQENNNYQTIVNFMLIPLL